MRRYAIIAALLAILALGANQVRVARLGGIEKCQRALAPSIVQLLAEYRVEHGRFPESLSDLPFNYPEDGSHLVHDLFRYEPGPNGFRLATTYAASGEQLSMEHREEAK